MTTILLGIIMGLGERQDGALLGLRDFAERIIQSAKEFNADISLMTGVWDNARSLLAIADASHEFSGVMLIGHSHGGHRAIEIADGHYGPVKQINWLIALDPKPPLFEHPMDFMLNTQYSIPKFANQCAAFYGGFGCRFVTGKNAMSVLLPAPYQGISGHPLIPQSPDVQEFCAVKLKEMVFAA